MNDFSFSVSSLLPMVIAQVPAASPDQLLAVLLGGAALLVIANQATIAYRNFSGKSQRREIDQPLEIRAAAEYARKDHQHTEYMMREDCHADHLRQRSELTEKFSVFAQQLEKLDATIAGGLTTINREAEARAATLHSRIDPIAKLAQSTTDRLEDHFNDHRSGRFDA